MTEPPMDMLFLVYRDLASAIAAVTHIDDTIRLYEASIDGGAILSRGLDRKIVLHDLPVRSAMPAAGKGAVLGAVIGSLFPPAALTSAFLGASITAIVDRLDERRIRDPIPRAIGERLGPGQSALLVVGDAGAIDRIAAAQIGYQSLAHRQLESAFVAAARDLSVPVPVNAENAARQRCI